PRNRNPDVSLGPTELTLDSRPGLGYAASRLAKLPPPTCRSGRGANPEFEPLPANRNRTPDVSLGPTELTLDSRPGLGHTPSTLPKPPPPCLNPLPLHLPIGMPNRLPKRRNWLQVLNRRPQIPMALGVSGQFNPHVRLTRHFPDRPINLQRPLQHRPPPLPCL